VKRIKRIFDGLRIVTLIVVDCL